MSYPPVFVTLCVPLMLEIEGTWYNLLQATAIQTERADGSVQIEFPLPAAQRPEGSTRTHTLEGEAADAVREWLVNHTRHRLLYALPPGAIQPDLPSSSGG